MRAKFLFTKFLFVKQQNSHMTFPSFYSHKKTQIT